MDDSAFNHNIYKHFAEDFLYNSTRNYITVIFFNNYIEFNVTY